MVVVDPGDGVPDHDRAAATTASRATRADGVPRSSQDPACPPEIELEQGDGARSPRLREEQTGDQEAGERLVTAVPSGTAVIPPQPARNAPVSRRESPRAREF